MGTLTDRELGDLLSRVTYLPGWTFKFHRDQHEGVVLTIEAMVPDAYHPEKDVMLRIHTYVPPVTTPNGFYEWLLWRLERIASHETREWLRVDGKPVSDPHAE